MEVFGIYLGLTMIILKLTKDLSLCTTVNDTANSTNIIKVTTVQVVQENLDIDTRPTVTADTILKYDKGTTTDSILNNSRKSSSAQTILNTTGKSKTKDTVQNDESGITTNDTDNQNKSDKIQITDTVLNEDNETVISDVLPNKNKNRNVTDTILNNNARTKVKSTFQNNLSTSTTSSNLILKDNNRSNTGDISLTFNNKSVTGDTILDNSGSATHISPWTTQCVANCTCFKDISDLGLHFDPPITLNTRMKIVNCTGRAYLNVPIHVPIGADVFYLNENNIFKLDKLPNLPQLIYFDLSNNHIQTLDNYQLFSQFGKLKYLTLGNNQIKRLEQSHFYGLYSLDNLDLGFNQISSIHPHAFVGLNHLKTLNLRGNRLTNITADWFKAVFDIRELDLSHNLLTSIESNILDPLTNLYSLNLADNKIRNIHLEAFRGLRKLKILNLSNNQISQVPTYQLRSASSLGKIVLNGNLMTKIKSGDFFNLNITSLSISFMDNLIVIEKLAFHALPLLENLFAHDNPELIYIDHDAFQLVPNLKRLYIHNNELSAVSPSMLNFLPNLEEIHLYHNPLRCDCNAFWVKEILESAKQNNYSKPYFNHSQFIKCGSPLNVTGKPITEVNENYFSKVCAPTTLQLFADKYELDLGEELQLECHAFGVPDPTIIWSLPNGTIIDPSMPRNRIIKPNDKISLINDCVLIVQHLSTKDSGTYSCKSDNGFGFDISSTRVIISNKPVRLFPYTVNSDYISVSWNGTQHKSMISDYQLHYREIANDNHISKGEPENSEVTVIQLGPQYHSYTVTKLKPQTKYEFCLIYLYKHESYKVDCQNISTQAQTVSEQGIQKLVSDKLVIGVSTAIGLIIVLTCIIMLAKKFCGQREYEHPYDSDESETINIPLDNLYQPLSVPICSSKTSLLNKHLD